MESPIFALEKCITLLLTGARQTGKTFAIRKFAKASGLKLVEINFLENPEATTVFVRSRDTQIRQIICFSHICRAE